MVDGETHKDVEVTALSCFVEEKMVEECCFFSELLLNSLRFSLPIHNVLVCVDTNDEGVQSFVESSSGWVSWRANKLVMTVVVFFREVRVEVDSVAYSGLSLAEKRFSVSQLMSCR